MTEATGQQGGGLGAVGKPLSPVAKGLDAGLLCTPCSLCDLRAGPCPLWAVGVMSGKRGDEEVTGRIITRGLC